MLQCKRLPHFLIRYAKDIAVIVARLYREITRLIQEQDGTATRYIRGLKRVAHYLALLKILKPHLKVVNKLVYQRRCARGSPVITETFVA